jgi:hypothetical protein
LSSNFTLVGIFYCIFVGVSTEMAWLPHPLGAGFPFVTENFDVNPVRDVLFSTATTNPGYSKRGQIVYEIVSVEHGHHVVAVEKLKADESKS